MEPISNTLVAILPAIDINAGLAGAANILRSPAFAPLVLLAVGVGLFMIIFYLIVDGVAYIMERFGIIRPLPMESYDDEIEDGIF